MNSFDLYIDLGTANTLIYGKGRGFLLNEPSAFAIKQGKFESTVMGFGHQAKTMLGRTPENVSVIRPLKEGVIADFDTTLKMLKGFLIHASNSHFWDKPSVVISLPCQVTQHEREAVVNVGLQAGARRVQLIDEPLAAAIGAGLNVLGHKANMVVDIGGGTTEIAVIASGGIVTSTAIRIGGEDITNRIVHDLRYGSNFVIGEQTAEWLKHQIAHIPKTSNSPSIVKSAVIGGFDLVRGLPRKQAINNTMIQHAVESVVLPITHTIRETLAALEPEVVVDIIENGILIAGGGALISGLDQYLSHCLGVQVNVADDPLRSVALGGAKTIEDPNLFESLELPLKITG